MHYRVPKDGIIIPSAGGMIRAAFDTVCIIFNGLEIKKTWSFSHPHK